eukprot:6985371-Alexandrium_andersonii.AAC.1
MRGRRTERAQPLGGADALCAGQLFGERLGRQWRARGPTCAGSRRAPCARRTVAPRATRGRPWQAATAH